MAAPGCRRWRNKAVKRAGSLQGRWAAPHQTPHQMNGLNAAVNEVILLGSSGPFLGVAESGELSSGQELVSEASAQLQPTAGIKASDSTTRVSLSLSVKWKRMKYYTQKA